MMTDKITPEAARETATNARAMLRLLFDDTNVPQMVADDVDGLATAYLAQVDEIERLRKRVEAADRLVAVIDTAVNKADDGKANTALEWLSSSKQEIAAYRATEDET